MLLPVSHKFSPHEFPKFTRLRYHRGIHYNNYPHPYAKKNIPKAYRTSWQFRILNLKTHCSRLQQIIKCLYTCFRQTLKKHAPCRRRGTNSTAQFLKLLACQQTIERFETLLWRHQRSAFLLLSDTGAVVHRGYANTGSCKSPGRSARTPHHSHYIKIT